MIPASRRSTRGRPAPPECAFVGLGLFNDFKTQETQVVYDAVIIGAGLAGLEAARDLRARGLRVTVLEARDRVGGRVENIVLPDGSYLEMGGQWIGSGFDALRELIAHYGLETVGIPEPDGRFIVRQHDKTHQVPTDGNTTVLNPFEVADLGQGLLRLRRLAHRLVNDEAWARANHLWLEQTLERWASANIRTEMSRARLAEVFASAFEVEAADTPLAKALHLVQDGPDLESMLAVNGQLEQLRVVGGLHELARRMAADLGDTVRLGQEVTCVRHRADGATVVLASGEEIEARFVISTLPPRLATALAHEPALPAWRAEESDKVNPGNVIKAYLLFDEPFWRARGLSGQSSADAGPVRVTFDTTPANASQGHLMGFFAGSEAVSLAKRTPQIRERAFLESVRASFGDGVPQPSGYVERDWTAEQFTQGCHGAHFAPGIWTTVGPGLAKPEGVLYWAGAEYATRFNGYMEGALRSGQAAAAAVASRCA